MAYQPSGLKSTNYAKMTIHEQHKWYFKACSNLRPARTIFYEQLIAQLIVWKHTDLDIILLSDFNENFYSGQIAQCLVLPDLMLSEQCLQCMGMHVPPTFREYCSDWCNVCHCWNWMRQCIWWSRPLARPDPWSKDRLYCQAPMIVVA